MNQVYSVPLAFLLVLSLGARPNYAQDDKTPPNQVPRTGDSEKFLGNWKVLSATTVDVPRAFGRQDFSKSEAEFEKAMWRITAEKISVNVGKESREATFKVAADKTPKALDINARLFPYYDKNLTTLAIYELKGDRLKICFSPKERERPAAFEPSGQNGQLYLFVIELQRERDAQRNDAPEQPRR